MEKEYRCLDLTVVSAEGLKDVNMFSKMDVYVVVELLGYGIGNNRKTTHIDRNGGTNPRWNHRIKFTIDEPSLCNNLDLSLLFQLKSERTFGSDRDIGEVTIPMQELYGDGAGANNSAERVVEYQVKTNSGKAKGTLKISYKFGEKVTHQPEANGPKGCGNEPVTAFPVGAASPQAGASMAYAPYPGMGYAAYPQAAYHQAHPGYAPPGYGGYPAQHGYPPAAPGYGAYGYAPPPGYGYAQPMQQVQQPKKNKGKTGMGAGLGLGLGAGLLGGMLVGDMVSDVGEIAAYDDGYGDAIEDMSGGFDF